MPESARTTNHLMLEAMDRYAAKTCLFVKQNRMYQSISFRQFRAMVFRLANYFCRLGGENAEAGNTIRGARVAIISRNCSEWLVSYIAARFCGAIVVPIRSTMPDHLLKYMLADCGASVAVVHGARQCKLIERWTDDLPNLKTVLVIDNLPEHLDSSGDSNGTNGTAEPVGADVVRADAPSKNGKAPETCMFPLAPILAEPLSATAEQAIRDRALKIEPSAPASIYYTTCEDGYLRGAVFDHGQRYATLQAMKEWFPLDEDDIAYTPPQPWSDLFNLDATLHYFVSGVPNAVANGDETEFEDLQHVSPTVTVTMPYAFEYVYLHIMSEMERLPRSNQEVFQWALTISKEYHDAGLGASPELRESYERADMTFFSNIRGMLGGRLRHLYSTGAHLNRQWFDFAEAIGMIPLNIYHITKAGGFPAVSRPNARRMDSVGQLAPGFQIRIADDGEVLVRGDTIARYYWSKPGEPIDAVDAEGWLHTGDLGRFDTDGYLYLTGHKQSPITLATGRKINPTAIEDRLMRSPLIYQAAICGEGRRYISALIVPDFPALRIQLQANGRIKKNEEISARHPGVVELIDNVIEAVNDRLDSWEQIQKYTILDGPMVDDAGQPIVNIKLNRHIIAERYSDALEAMYPGTLPFEEKPVTQVQLHPEHLRQLLEKEDILDAWMNDAGISFLFEMARTKQIDAPSMVHICETAAAIAQMQNEEEPLSTAFIVGNPSRIARILPESPLQLRQYDHIRRMRRTVTTLAKIVDGHVFAYAVDKHGIVRGVHRLEVPLEPLGSDLTGPHFRHLAAISKQCDSVVFSVPTGGRLVRVFADGQLIGRYVNGAWQQESMVQIDAAVARLSEHKHYDLQLLRRLLRVAFKMSERNRGAILMLGDADTILERSDASEIRNVATIVNVPVADISDDELIAFAKQDGATVVDLNGELRGCMVLLRPAATTQAQIGPGKGARHSSAAKISAETHSIAIIISQDGPIAVYDSGMRVLSL